MNKITILLVISLFFAASSALAVSKIAYLQKIDGKVEYKNKKEDLHWTKAKKVMQIYPDNMLKTSKNSQAQIRYMDGKTLFTMMPDSEVIVKEEKLGMRAVYHQIGEVHFDSTDVRMIIETPTAIQLSKGTQWESMVDKDGQTTVTVNKGSIVLKNDVDEETVEVGSKAIVETKDEEITVEVIKPSKELRIEFQDTEGQLRTLVIQYEEEGLP